MFCFHHRAPIIYVTYRNVLEQCSFFLRTTTVFIFIFLPRYNPRFPPSSPSYSRVKGGSGLEREKISGEISRCLLETRRKYFTRCIIWLDVPSFRGIYDRASLRWTSISVQRSTSNSEFYPPSVILVPCPRKYPPRQTRTCGARGGTCPLVTLQLEEICRQDVVGRARGVSTLMQLYVYEVPEISGDIFAIACTVRPLRWLLG